MAINFGSGVGQVIQTVKNVTNLTYGIAANASGITSSGVTTSITPKQTGSDFIVTFAGHNAHCNYSASNAGIKLYLYASVAGGSYVNVLNNFAVAAHTTTSWIDFPQEWTVYVGNSAVSYTAGQVITFDPRYQQGSSGSGSTNYFHHAGGSGNGTQLQTIIQEVAS